MSLEPAGPLDVRSDLRVERAAFVALLRGLGDADWRQPTECPAYDVQGVATHILGDDFSLLSRQRDAAPSGLFALWGPGEDLRTVLDRFNDRWVVAAEFFSPTLLIDLLERTGEWTADWYDAVDLESPGEPVGFFAATGPSPYWQIAAREYVERWVHHHQIRRALARPDLADDVILLPAASTVMRFFRAHLRSCGAHPGDAILLTIDRLASWTLRRDDDAWILFDGRVDDARAELTIERALATPMMSRGMRPTDVEAAIAVQGDAGLGDQVKHGLVALASQA